MSQDSREKFGVKSQMRGWGRRRRERICWKPDKVEVV